MPTPATDALLKAYRLALQLLLMVALPIAVFFTFASTPMIRVLGGASYLPDSAIALRLMIWSIPIGFINSVTQYMLIAVGQQRFITRAFLIAVTWTAVSNFVLVPRFGAVAAAALLIPAELSLFLPFRWAVGRYVGQVSWVGMLSRPVLATIANLVVVWGLDRLGMPLLALRWPWGSRSTCCSCSFSARSAARNLPCFATALTAACAGPHPNQRPDKGVADGSQTEVTLYDAPNPFSSLKASPSHTARPWRSRICA